MKKLLLLSLLSLLTFTAIANAQITDKKVLVVYYSHTGNTEVIANKIKTLTNADSFRIEPVTEYTKDHKALVEQSRVEISDGFLPKIKDSVKNINDYDVVFIGSPVWFATIAPPVATFLSNHDLTGKTLIPFVTHEGSYMGRTAEDIAKLAPNATLLKGNAFRGKNVKETDKEINTWLQDLNL